MTKETFKRFEILAPQCKLCAGDSVYPDTLVGEDYTTGELVYAGCFGSIRRKYTNPSHHSVMVLIAINSPGLVSDAGL